MQSGAKRALFEHVKHDRDLGILFRDVTGKALQYPWHFHPELELTHIVRGSGRRHVGDSIEPFDDGDLCLVGSNTPHCWLTEHGEERDVHARVIQFVPESMARRILSTASAWRARIVGPAIEAPLALCQSDKLPLSEPAHAVKEILLDLAAKLPGAKARPGGRKGPQRT